MAVSLALNESSMESPSVRNYAENFNSGGVLRASYDERRSVWTRTRTGSQRSGTSSRGPNGSTRTATASQKANDLQHSFQSHGSRPIDFSQTLTGGPSDSPTARPRRHTPRPMDPPPRRQPIDPAR